MYGPSKLTVKYGFEAEQAVFFPSYTCLPIIDHKFIFRKGITSRILPLLLPGAIATSPTFWQFLPEAITDNANKNITLYYLITIGKT